MLSQYLITSIFYRTLTFLFKVLKAKLCWTLFSGPLIIVIALLRVLIYYKMPLERTEQCWILKLELWLQHYTAAPCLPSCSSLFTHLLDTCILQPA